VNTCFASTVIHSKHPISCFGFYCFQTNGESASRSETNFNGFNLVYKCTVRARQRICFWGFCPGGSCCGKFQFLSAEQLRGQAWRRQRRRTGSAGIGRRFRPTGSEIGGGEGTAEDQIEELRQRGAQGIVLGCTEFPLIIRQADVSIPVFDTTLLHSQMAVDFILGKQGLARVQNTP
jgi:hypothetical protein